MQEESIFNQQLPKRTRHALALAETQRALPCTPGQII
ncbi:hypothetical protein [Klebsiella phage vB_KshKPC-M]|nr:hypothetical protein [Klebsiella phage vB_KshKPC-M]